jgi:hypothetical protein
VTKNNTKIPINQSIKNTISNNDSFGSATIPNNISIINPSLYPSNNIAIGGGEIPSSQSPSNVNKSFKYINVKTSSNANHLAK